MQTELNDLIADLTGKLATYYLKSGGVLSPPAIRVEEKSRYFAIHNGTSIWFFIDKTGGTVKGHPTKAGDILMPASCKTPAAHTRGNLFDRSTWGCIGPHGVKYLKNIGGVGW